MRLAFLDIEGTSDERISCVGLRYKKDGEAEEVKSFYGWEGEDIFAFADSEGAIDALGTAIAVLVADNFRIFTWAGATYDWERLNRVAPQFPWRRWALNSYDPYLQALYLSGSLVGMAAAARGFGLRTKLQKGADAPVLWDLGLRQAVIDYVVDDTRLLSEIITAISKQRGLLWQDRAAGFHLIPFLRFMRVGEVIQLPAPDLSWMTEGDFNLSNQLAWLQSEAK
jgi:hypothetical protein